MTEGIESKEVPDIQVEEISESESSEDHFFDDENESVDLSALSEYKRKITDEELLELLVSKHRFND